MVEHSLTDFIHPSITNNPKVVTMQIPVTPTQQAQPAGLFDWLTNWLFPDLQNWIALGMLVFMLMIIMPMMRK